VSVLELSRTDARRLAVRAQLLCRPRPDDLLDVVRALGALHDDRTASIAPSADLVVWSRIGSSLDRQALDDALAEQRLVDLRGIIRPVEDIALHRAEMQQWDDGADLEGWQAGLRQWLAANEGCRRDILDRLRQDGPLGSRDLPDTCDVPWRSSGWNSGRNVSRMLDVMSRTGDVAVTGRNGRDRLWDLADRVYPDEVVPAEEALRIRNERRLRALGIARVRGPECAEEPIDVGGEAGVPAVVDGVRGTWRVDPTLLDEPFAGRAALLSPFDALIFDRKRMTELFEFDYQLEIYKPVGQRRWGYYALPILYGDRLVGKIDAAADRAAGVLQVNAIHQDVPFSKTMSIAVRREITDLARWLELDLTDQHCLLDHLADTR
jgi:uncharacterized protein YcaQ